MCERHERLYREAAEQHDLYVSLQERIIENPDDLDAVRKYTCILPSPPKIDRVRDRQIQNNLIRHLSMLNPPFSALITTSFQFYSWMIHIECLMIDEPSDAFLQEMFKKAAESVISNDPTYRSTGCCALAIAHACDGQYQQAVEMFRNCTSPINIDLFTISLVEVGRYQEAIDLFNAPRSASEYGCAYAQRICTRVGCLRAVARAFENLGREDEANNASQQAGKEAEEEAKWNALKQREALPDDFARRFELLLPEEKEILSSRFAFGPRFDHVPLIYRDFGSTDADIEYVKHVEAEAMRQLGVTYEYLMNLCHPGFVHNENAPTEKERLGRYAKIVFHRE